MYGRAVGKLRDYHLFADELRRRYARIFLRRAGRRSLIRRIGLRRLPNCFSRQPTGRNRQFLKRLTQTSQTSRPQPSAEPNIATSQIHSLIG